MIEVFVSFGVAALVYLIILAAVGAVEYWLREIEMRRKLDG